MDDETEVQLEVERLEHVVPKEAIHKLPNFQRFLMALLPITRNLTAACRVLLLFDPSLLSTEYPRLNVLRFLYAAQ